MTSKQATNTANSAQIKGELKQFHPQVSTCVTIQDTKNVFHNDNHEQVNWRRNESILDSERQGWEIGGTFSYLAIHNS